MRNALAIMVLIGFLATSPALAQRSFGLHGIGPRMGISIDPDQFHFGVHFDLGDLAPRTSLLPNLEAGVGDDFTIITTMFEVDHRFRERWGSWNPYIGGGIGPVFVSHSGLGGDDTELGLTAQGGLVRRLGNGRGSFFFELKLGLANTPDFKLTAGWNFATRRAP